MHFEIQNLNTLSHPSDMELDLVVGSSQLNAHGMELCRDRALAEALKAIPGSGIPLSPLLCPTLRLFLQPGSWNEEDT